MYIYIVTHPLAVKHVWKIYELWRQQIVVNFDAAVKTFQNCQLSQRLIEACNFPLKLKPFSTDARRAAPGVNGMSQLWEDWNGSLELTRKTILLCKWQIQVQRQFLPIPTDERRRLLLDSKLSLHDVRNEYLILPNPPSQSTSLLSSAEHHPLSRPIEINPKTGNRSEMKTKQKKYWKQSSSSQPRGGKGDWKVWELW